MIVQPSVNMSHKFSELSTSSVHVNNRDSKCVELSFCRDCWICSKALLKDIVTNTNFYMICYVLRVTNIIFTSGKVGGGGGGDQLRVDWHLV